MKKVWLLLLTLSLTAPLAFAADDSTTSADTTGNSSPSADHPRWKNRAAERRDHIRQRIERWKREHPNQELPQDLKKDVEELKNDHKELRADRKEIRSDRQEIRQDIRSGDKKELLQDKKELQSDRKEYHSDRQDLRGDRRDTRKDFRDFKNSNRRHGKHK